MPRMHELSARRVVWNAFVCVSLRLESLSRKALVKQYLFAVRFQLVFFFFPNKRLRHSRYMIWLIFT